MQKIFLNILDDEKWSGVAGFEPAVFKYKF